MKVHFIAIGGSAMHNLAIALKQKGYEISGSDDEIFEPSRSRLANHGILPGSIGWFPDKISNSLDAVIVGMHARDDNPELIRSQQLGLAIYSYPEFLYNQSIDKKRVVIGGSHGKTTITAMVLHVLAHAGVETDYMVGAQLEGFDVMVRLSESAKWMVMEGDEYLTSPVDRRPKFLLYKPHIAVISGIAWDHINVFPRFDDYVEQFRLFIQSIVPGGLLVYYNPDDQLRSLSENYRGNKIAYEKHPFTVAENITQLVMNTGENIPLQIFGSHNMANLNAARIVCNQMGLNDSQFYAAIQSFKGASRRLEFIAERDGVLRFRDFAHAPSKVKASVEALREQYPQKAIIVCLELHTFSSLNEDFIDQYKNTLKDADVTVVFYDPHAVAMKRLPELDHDRIRNAFDHHSLHVFNDPKQLQYFLLTQRKEGSVWVMMSSGNFKGLDFEQF